MLQQLVPDTAAAGIGINKKRLHMCPIDQHEATGFVIFIDGNSHWRMGQKTTHVSINGLSVYLHSRSKPLADPVVADCGLCRQWVPSADGPARNNIL
jgi:hypothetical protein